MASETIEQVCDEIQVCCNCWKGHKRTDLTVDALQAWHDRLVAAHKREIAAKDGDLLLRDCMIAERDALIKNLVDALNPYLGGECIDCGAKCEGDGACVHQKQFRALVKNALEVVK